MNIVLIRPPEHHRIWAGIPPAFDRYVFLFPPLGIMQLSAYLRQHTDARVFIYDSLIHNSDYHQIASYVVENQTRLVGISTFTHSLTDVIKTAQAIKKRSPNVHITLGGPHTYSFPEQCRNLLNFDSIDSIVIGDGEEPLTELVKTINDKQSLSLIKGLLWKDEGGGIQENQAARLIEDLNALPFPARDKTDLDLYFTPASSGARMTTISSSRGCPFTCSFCNVPKKYRLRSPEHVVDEMEDCLHLGFREFFFIDDTFNITPDRVISISQHIIKRKLRAYWGFKARCDNVTSQMLALAKRAGCFRIHYGVESGTEEGLASMNKKVTKEQILRTFELTKDAGLKTIAYFIIGCPHERTIHDIDRTIEFACRLPADYAVFSLLAPHPDTFIYRKGVEDGIIDGKAWPAYMQNPLLPRTLPTYWPEYFSKRQLIDQLNSAHRRFYFRPKTIINALRLCRSRKEANRLMIGGFSIVSNMFATRKEKVSL